jgi:hypothetical protein
VLIRGMGFQPVALASAFELSFCLRGTSCAAKKDGLETRPTKESHVTSQEIDIEHGVRWNECGARHRL